MMTIVFKLLSVAEIVDMYFFDSSVVDKRKNI